MKHQPTSTCAGCGRRMRRVYAGGIWLNPGTGAPLVWMLCGPCKDELAADEQKMLMRIELRLGVMQGTA